MVKNIYEQIFSDLGLKKTADEKNPDNSLDLPASPATSVTPGSLFHRFLEKYRAASPKDRKTLLSLRLSDLYDPHSSASRAWSFLQLDSPNSIFLPEEKKKIIDLINFFSTNFREYNDPESPNKPFTLHNATYNRPFYHINQFLQNHNRHNKNAKLFFHDLYKKDDKSKPYYLRLFGIHGDDYLSTFRGDDFRGDVRFLFDLAFGTNPRPFIPVHGPRFYEDLFYRLFVPELDKNNVPVFDPETKRVKLKLNPRFHETEPYDNILRSFLPPEGSYYYLPIDPMFSPNAVLPGLFRAYYNYFKDPGVAERFPDYVKLQNIYLKQFNRPFIQYLNNLNTKYLFDAANADINNLRQEYLRYLVKNPLVNRDDASEYAKLLFASSILPNFLRMHGVPESLVQEISSNTFNKNLLDGNNFYRTLVGDGLLRMKNFKDIKDIKSYYDNISSEFWEKSLPSSILSYLRKPIDLKSYAGPLSTLLMANLLNDSLKFYMRNEDSNKKVPVEFFDDLFEKLAPSLMDIREQARVASAIANDAKILENNVIYSFENLRELFPHPDFTYYSVLDFIRQHVEYWIGRFLNEKPQDLFNRVFINHEGFLRYLKFMDYLGKLKSEYPEDYKKFADAVNRYYNFNTFVLGVFSNYLNLHEFINELGYLPITKILD